MRLALAILLSSVVLSAHAEKPVHPDPLAVLITQLSAPLDDKAADAPSSGSENSPRLAQIQSSLTVAAAGFEALRGEVRHNCRAKTHMGRPSHTQRLIYIPINPAETAAQSVS